MFFFEKKTRFTTAFSKKPLLIKSLALLLICTSSAKAERVGIYNHKTDEVAGVTALMSAVVSQDIQGVIFFSKSGKAIVNQKNYGGATALHLAARSNQIEVSKVLIANGARIDAIDNENWTPLMRATLAGNLDMIKLLLEKGAQADAKNSVKETIIDQAIVANCNECLSAILNGFDFPKFVKVKTLTQWLNKSYGNAHNKGDEGAKQIISNYLDIILADDKAARNSFSQDFQEGTLEAPVARAVNGKIFKFAPKKPVLEAVEVAPVIVPEKPIAKPIVKPIVNSQEKSLEKAPEQEIATPTKSAQKVPTPIKSFKFNSIKTPTLPMEEKKEVKKMEKSQIEEKSNEIIELDASPKKSFKLKWWGSKKELKNDVSEINAETNDTIIDEAVIEVQEETVSKNDEMKDIIIEEPKKKHPEKFRFKKGKTSTSPIQVQEESVDHFKDATNESLTEEPAPAIEAVEIEESKPASKKRFKLWGNNKKLDNATIQEEEAVEEIKTEKPRSFKFKKGGEYI